jgi:hypothetical protein
MTRCPLDKGTLGQYYLPLSEVDTTSFGTNINHLTNHAKVDGVLVPSSFRESHTKGNDKINEGRSSKKQYCKQLKNWAKLASCISNIGPIYIYIIIGCC